MAALRIYEDFMSLEVDGREVATAEWSKYNTADCNRGVDRGLVHQPLFTRSQAITALTVAELRAAGRGDDDPVVATLLSELRW